MPVCTAVTYRFDVNAESGFKVVFQSGNDKFGVGMSAHGAFVWTGRDIRPLNGAYVLLAIMDIRAHPISFSDRPLKAASATRLRMRRRDRFSIS